MGRVCVMSCGTRRSNMEVAQKILEFLDEPEFCQRFRKFNDSRKWVATLSRKKAISDAHLQSIQSKPTSDEANDYLLTLIKNDPSIKKLEVLSEALKEDDTHNNQLALAKMIDQFLVSMVKGKLYSYCLSIML